MMMHLQGLVLFEYHLSHLVILLVLMKLLTEFVFVFMDQKYVLWWYAEADGLLVDLGGAAFLINFVSFGASTSRS